MNDPSRRQEHESRSSSAWNYIFIILAIVLCVVLVIFALGEKVNTTFSNVASALPGGGGGGALPPQTVPDPDELQRVPDPDEIERKFER